MSDSCPCCGKQIDNPYTDDGPFCWDCGLYASDPAGECDNPDHQTNAARKAEEEFAALMFDADPSIAPKDWRKS